MARKSTSREKKVETLTHEQATRRNIPTAEHQSLAQRQEETAPIGPILYARVHPLTAGAERERDKDIDPQIIWNGARIRLTEDQIRQLQEHGEIEIGDAQLVWRGKDQQDWSDLVVNAPPLYIQEKVHPKAIIDHLVRQTKEARKDDEAPSLFGDLFADFNGLDSPEARTEFYQHSQHWSNRMILGDSLQVMASLAEREHLRGQVQCIYFDPPYGIKFNSNWQVSTRTPSVKDGKQAEITREPEQVKAFRDTWKDGIHSYLTYLRDRLTVARDLLHESGSIFVQIGDENVHRVRALMDEVFGDSNCIATIIFTKTTGQTDNLLATVTDTLLWYAKDRRSVKYRQVYKSKLAGGEGGLAYTRARNDVGKSIPFDQDEAPPLGYRLFTTSDLTSQSPGTKYEVAFEGGSFFPKGYWKTEAASFPRLIKADRIAVVGNGLRYIRYFDDNPIFPINNSWGDTGIAGFAHACPLSSGAIVG